MVVWLRIHENPFVHAALILIIGFFISFVIFAEVQVEEQLERGEH